MSKADQAAKLLAAARKSSEEGGAAEAIKAAKEALGIFRDLGEGSGIGSALGCLLTSQLAAGQVTLEDALSTIRDESSKLTKVGGKLGEGALLLATGQVYAAALDSDRALKAGLEAQAIFAKEGAALQEADAICKVIVGGYLGNSNEEKALAAANQALSLAQQADDKKTEASAWFVVASARYAAASLEDTLEACTKALSLFKDLGDKCKEAETTQLMSQVYLATEDAQAALSSAKHSLQVAGAVGSGPLKAAAVELIVEAQILGERPQEGLEVAQEQLSSLEKSGKTAGVAEMMCVVVVATAAVRGASEGFERVKKFVESCRSAGNLQGEVKMLHRMACMSEYPDVALNTAQAALKLAQKTGDVAEEARIKMTLTDLWVARGEYDKAPTRKLALALLNELSRDLEKRDVERFQETNKKLNKHWAVLTKTDMEATIYKVISKDPESCMAFLKENGLMADEGVKKEGPISGHKFRQVPVANLYMGFRIGGLGYGPRYRVCTSNKTLHAPEAMGIVELQDCSDDWERELGYSPSLLDGCLQTGAAMGH